MGQYGGSAAPALPHVPMRPEVRDPIIDAIGLGAISSSMLALLQPIPRCECCYETRHVARDGYGGVTLVCARCDYQIRATGCCHLHHGRLVYPELAKPAPVPSPREIEELFFTPESTRPKYDAAELAEADA